MPSQAEIDDLLQGLSDDQTAGLLQRLREGAGGGEGESSEGGSGPSGAEERRNKDQAEGSSVTVDDFRKLLRDASEYREPDKPRAPRF